MKTVTGDVYGLFDEEKALQSAKLSSAQGRIDLLTSPMLLLPQRFSPKARRYSAIPLDGLAPESRGLLDQDVLATVRRRVGRITVRLLAFILYRLAEIGDN
jgi:hypothetical protein